MDLLEMDISKGKMTQLRNKGIESVEDIINFIPRKYFDFRTPVAIKDLKEGMVCSVIGKVENITQLNFGSVIKVRLVDSSDANGVELVWFNQQFMSNILKEGLTYIVCGKTSYNTYSNSIQFSTPMFIDTNIEKYQKIVPVYSKIKGMSEEYLLGLIEKSFKLLENSKEYLDADIVKKFDLISQYDSFKELHNPVSGETYLTALKRFQFDTLFKHAMDLELRAENASRSSEYKIVKDSILREFKNTLPYELTEGQNDVLRDCYIKMKKGIRVNTLVQGDVGSGKTIVAIILMLLMAENGYQSTLMAPTKVLAKQHYEELCKLLEGFNFNIVFLSGDMKVKERREAVAKIKSGEAHMIVGTHTVISKDVEYSDLGITIVDEEHRFGVEQRELLSQKAKVGVHSISMSATPIPRSLTLSTLGSAIEVKDIKSMPKGREPIKTAIVNNDMNVYKFMYKEITAGRQCYVVCPLIEDSDYEGLSNVESVETTYENLKKVFNKYPNVKIGAINGNMKQADVDLEIEKFANKEYDIIVSTTIIEVGVNVPNSTVIAIKNAERFGLSQLHQLRGRVGRGSYQSYCILMSQDVHNEKLQAMCSTTDGFEISEIDMKLRGSGDLLGLKQSGKNETVDLIVRKPEFYGNIVMTIQDILKEENGLERLYKMKESKEL